MKEEEQFSYDHEREPMKYDDETIRKELKAIDEDDTVTVESNEADFIENILIQIPKFNIVSTTSILGLEYHREV